jgi:DNA-binding CsgD family transcriptional regulator
MNISKRLIGVWRTMHNRCYNPNQKCYPNYGGRGILVDACWHGAEGFKKFLSDMGKRPEGGTLERKDNNGNYGPENCRWATRIEQAKNKRNSRFLTANGQTKTLKEWADLLGGNSATILYRLKKGMSEQDALTTPISERPNAKLGAQEVLLVRSSYPTMTAQAIAEKLSVSKKTVLNIIHGKTFADVI